MYNLIWSLLYIYFIILCFSLPRSLFNKIKRKYFTLLREKTFLLPKNWVEKDKLKIKKEEEETPNKLKQIQNSVWGISGFGEDVENIESIVNRGDVAVG